MIICLTGPTGVGKTKLSIMLAHKYNAIIIGADATQVYQELDIGSAKIKEEEKEGVPHFLIDIKSPKESYTVYDYQKDLRDLLAKYKNQNIIITGGTGLYITAGLYDYKFSERYNNDYSSYTNEELYAMCKEIDENIDIHLNNRRRLENYLNKKDKKIVEPKLLYDNVIFIGLTTDRDILYKRINERVEEMFQEGLVEEVKDLYQKYPTSRILHSAIGYKEIIAYLENKISLDAAKELIKKNSRHYAKRQYTWFNNKMHIQFFQTNFNDFNKTYEEVIKYIEKETNC